MNEPTNDSQMKAIVSTGHGSPDVLEYRMVDKPTPLKDEVLIRVHASTVTSGDVVMLGLHPLLYLPMGLLGFKRKIIPGHEFAGEITAVGNKITRFKVGDCVFGTTTGLRSGANAEYVCVPELWADGVLALKPSNITFEEAAAVPVGGMTALFFLGNGAIRSGENVLVYGASGSVGTFAVQLAKHFGAAVTAVCSTGNVELVRSLGADKVLDYTRGDFANGLETYDVVFDAVGKLASAETKRLLAQNGRILSVKTSTREKTESLVFLSSLIEAGKLHAVIDQLFPLQRTADAYRYVQQGHKRGNVVITMGATADN